MWASRPDSMDQSAVRASAASSASATRYAAYDSQDCQAFPDQEWIQDEELTRQSISPPRGNPVHPGGPGPINETSARISNDGELLLHNRQSQPLQQQQLQQQLRSHPVRMCDLHDKDSCEHLDAPDAVLTSHSDHPGEEYSCDVAWSSAAMAAASLQSRDAMPIHQASEPSPYSSGQKSWSSPSEPAVAPQWDVSEDAQPLQSDNIPPVGAVRDYT